MRGRHDEHACDSTTVLAGLVELCERPLHRVALLVLGLHNHGGAGESALLGEAHDRVPPLRACNIPGRIPRGLDDAWRPLNQLRHKLDDTGLEHEPAARARLLLLLACLE